MRYFKYKCLNLFLLLIGGYSYADCTFEVVNYSSNVIKVEVGFLGHDAKSGELEIPNTGTRVLKLTSPHNCLSHTGADVGIAYIHLIGGQSRGSWVYSPEGSMIRAVGQTTATSLGVYGVAPNGHNLVLNNNYKPTEQKFAVVIRDADRNLTKIGSMN